MMAIPEASLTMKPDQDNTRDALYLEGAVACYNLCLGKKVFRTCTTKTRIEEGPLT